LKVLEFHKRDRMSSAVNVYITTCIHLNGTSV
jgi:hypothetical protein